MTDTPIDEPDFQPDEDSDDEPAIDTPVDDVQEPSIVTGVGSSALGSIDIEPQSGHHPDNDGETVEE
jgi:hypothetical protein